MKTNKKLIKIEKTGDILKRFIEASEAEKLALESFARFRCNACKLQTKAANLATPSNPHPTLEDIEAEVVVVIANFAHRQTEAASRYPEFMEKLLNGVVSLSLDPPLDEHYRSMLTDSYNKIILRHGGTQIGPTRAKKAKTVESVVKLVHSQSHKKPAK